ncbi:MAG TPA: hypothetical protein VHP32_06460 [Ignavibacteria bacterium]|nr:hypothetical protein [Ignavibacteria bacterium]
MKIKLLFIISFFALLFLSSNINAQTMVFSTGVGSDCAPQGTGTSFALGKAGTKIYAIVNLTSDLPDTSSVTFQVFKDGQYDFSSTIDLPAKTNCYWVDLVFYKAAAWTIKAIDPNGNMIASGTVNVTSN